MFLSLTRKFLNPYRTYYTDADDGQIMTVTNQYYKSRAVSPVDQHGHQETRNSFWWWCCLKRKIIGILGIALSLNTQWIYRYPFIFEADILLRHLRNDIFIPWPFSIIICVSTIKLHNHFAFVVNNKASSLFKSRVQIMSCRDKNLYCGLFWSPRMRIGHNFTHACLSACLCVCLFRLYLLNLYSELWTFLV